MNTHNRLHVLGELAALQGDDSGPVSLSKLFGHCTLSLNDFLATVDQLFESNAVSYVRDGENRETVRIGDGAVDWWSDIPEARLGHPTDDTTDDLDEGWQS